MTDKQIIIDGVDVSKCPNHYNGWSALHRDHRPMCECGYDRECKPKDFECSHYVKCLEKQLKRKEQECEELKEKYKWYDHYKEQALYNKNLCNEKSEQLDRLKAENKRLQKEREKAKNYNLEYGQLLIKATNKNNKLSKTLTEIKEIAEPYQKEIDKICGNCRRYDGCHACCMDTLNNYE